MKHKICFVTGTRAEYGLFHPLMKRIKTDPFFELQIIATCMHLSPEFGLTYREIERDGFHINRKVEMLLSSDTEAGVTKSTGLGMIGFADAFAELKPHLVFLLGDRFETLAAAIAAHFARIPIAHLHGGELTEGAVDDAIRHAITKMSLLHFVSTETYRKRVIQLGEAPERVFTVGALGIDNIKFLKLVSQSQLEQELGIQFSDKNVLVTFHPVTLENKTSERQFRELLKALDAFDDLRVIFTKPNADANGRIIIHLIDEYVKSHPARASAYITLGQVKYLSALKYVDAVVGNSSSGILEAPSFGKPSVNIGDRQKGRVRPESVIDCEPKMKDIIRAIKKALSVKFQDFCRKVKNPYGDGAAAQKIHEIVKREIPEIGNLKKSFFDLKEIQRGTVDHV